MIETIWLIHVLFCELTLVQWRRDYRNVAVHDEASIVSEQLIRELKGLIEGGQIEEARDSAVF